MNISYKCLKSIVNLSYHTWNQNISLFYANECNVNEVPVNKHSFKTSFELSFRFHRWSVLSSIAPSMNFRVVIFIQPHRAWAVHHNSGLVFTLLLFKMQIASLRPRQPDEGSFYTINNLHWSIMYKGVWHPWFEGYGDNTFQSHFSTTIKHKVCVH